MRQWIREHRKALAVIGGGIGTTLLEWATTSTELEQAAEQLVPHALVPVVPLLFGFLGTYAAVKQIPNDQPPAAILDQPAPPADADEVHRSAQQVVSAGTAPAAGPADAPQATDANPAAGPVDDPPWWAGVHAGAPTSPTSLIRLQPPDDRHA